MASSNEACTRVHVCVCGGREGGEGAGRGNGAGDSVRRAACGVRRAACGVRRGMHTPWRKNARYLVPHQVHASIGTSLWNGTWRERFSNQDEGLGANRSAARCSCGGWPCSRGSVCPWHGPPHRQATARGGTTPGCGAGSGSRHGPGRAGEPCRARAHPSFCRSDKTQRMLQLGAAPSNRRPRP